MTAYGSPTFGRAIYSTQAPDSNVNLIRKAFTETPRIIFNQILGIPISIKLAHKSDHHNYGVSVSETKESVTAKRVLS